MRSARCSVFCLLACIICLGVAGCAGSTHPETTAVEGKVTWQGKALPNGTVIFDPVHVAAGMPMRPARGEIDPDGVYRLSTFRRGDGIVAGEYRVTVQSYIKEPMVGQPGVWRIPERYGDPSTSGLTFTVPADASGTLTYDINLE